MKLMVLDGNSIVNRAFYGIRMLTTRDGMPTNAVYGFLAILQKLLADEKPDALCVTFDLKEPTFRHKMYDGYKAQRKGMPEELAVQMPLLKEVLDAMNIPRYELAGWEADDLIGTISARCAASGWQCVPVTGDKDSLQLISDLTAVHHVKTVKGHTETVLYTQERFREEYGFEPKKLIDLKALMGDSSDNLPGVPGVGDKTAMDLLLRFGSLQGVYDNLDSPDIKAGVRKKLEEGRALAFLCYDLASIRCDAPIEFAPEDNIIRAVDNDALYETFKRLEFYKMIDKYGLTPPAEAGAQTPSSPAAEWSDRRVGSERDLDMLRKSIAGADELYVFWEEDSPFLCCAVASERFLLEEGSGVFDEAVRLIFESGAPIASYKVKELHRRLLNRGIVSASWSFDCALAAYLLSPTDSAYPLDALCMRYLNRPMEGTEEEESGQLSLLSGTPAGEQTFGAVAAVAELTPVLREKLSQNGAEKLFNEIELPLCSVLAEMEQEGFLVDRDALQAFGSLLAERLAVLEQQIYERAGEKFNINSPKQLGHILFEVLMLPAPKKTKTGYSTGADVLEKLSAKHPIVREVLEYRQLAKLKSTYAEGLSSVIAADGRIHTNFQMTVTATGRLSSTEPNLQNIPVRTDLGGEIRKMFIAGPGNVLVDADYSQIELRLLAAISGDEAMQNAFITGEDIHAVTASQVFGVPLENVTKQQRSYAKAVNFGIVYGISAFSLSEDIHVSVQEAKAYIDSYLQKYSGVKEYMTCVVAQAKEKGYVETLYGRRRALPELNSSNHNVRAFGERVALNMPIQGTAADIMKLAMLRVSAALKKNGLKAKLLLQVHDELICECPEEEADTVARLLAEEMQAAAQLAVPLTAEAKSAKSWYDAK